VCVLEAWVTAESLRNLDLVHVSTHVPRSCIMYPSASPATVLTSRYHHDRVLKCKAHACMRSSSRVYTICIGLYRYLLRRRLRYRYRFFARRRCDPDRTTYVTYGMTPRQTCRSSKQSSHAVRLGPNNNCAPWTIYGGSGKLQRPSSSGFDQESGLQASTQNEALPLVGYLMVIVKS
jgi:hypothetical protein